MRGVLLDFYGTLVFEDDAIIAEICAAVQEAVPEGLARPTARQIGTRWWDHFRNGYATARGTSFITQRELGRRSLLAAIAEVGSHADADALLAKQFAFWQAPPMFPETPRVLATLQDLGLSVCIVSNIDRQDIEAAMAVHGLEADHVLTSEDVRSYKPNPELFLTALDRLRLTTADVLHIGDSRTSDVAGATALGIPVAWVNRAGKRSDADPAATYEVQSLDAALPLIQRLSS